ncbi:MAG: leucine-rich repeat protein [Clostridia bacterium]|nr:leucine-rich repeat protein [Clostridia bacterium]
MRFVKILLCFLALFACLAFFGGCSEEEEAPQEDIYYKVVFDSAGGSSTDEIKVLSGSKIARPEDPEKEGYIFNGWRKDAVEWDFANDKVTSDLTLTAGWIDAKTIFDYEIADGKATLTKYKGKLDSIRIPTQIAGYPVVAIGDEAFMSTAYEKTQEITVGENIKVIGSSAFAGCAGIRLTLECKPVSIGEKAFAGCTALGKITLGSGLTAIPVEAFLGCTGLESVILSDTTETVGENAFDGCTALKSVTAHSSLKTVSDSAFLGCSSLKAIYYYGTAEQWAQTQIAEGNNGNDTLMGAYFYMYSEAEPPKDAKGKYWYFKDDGSIRIW